MSITTTEVDVGLSGKNIKYYKNKGYKIPKRKDKNGVLRVPRSIKIMVKVEDLPLCSMVKVDVQCDGCGIIKNMTYEKYIQQLRHNKWYCIKCTYNGNTKWQSVFESRPDLIKYFVDINEAKEYTIGSHKNINIKCPDCGFIRQIPIKILASRGFVCPKCGDGISYPEKFVLNFLEQLNVDFIYQKVFTWSNKKRYDFYIPSINYIVEVHGIQHYEAKKGFYDGKFENIQKSDQLKQQLALKNNISEYIVLDCRYSNLGWIKNDIMQSYLPILLNFKEEDIDWLKCHKNAMCSLMTQACNLWNGGMKNVKKIANELCINRKTVTSYLKQCSELSLCDYDPYKQITTKVICLNTNKAFPSIKEAAEYFNIECSGISFCCSGKTKYSGKHFKTGEKLYWMYYEDYLVMQKNNQIKN